MQKSGVVLGVHDAEADVFAVQAFEGGAVTDHEPLKDEGVEDVQGGQDGILDFQEIYDSKRPMAANETDTQATGGEDEKV